MLKPINPTGVTGQLIAGKPKLTWKPVFNADSYTVYRETGANTGYVEVQGSIIDTGFTDQTVQAGKQYSYKVLSVNKAGLSDLKLAEAKSFTIPSLDTTPPVITFTSHPSKVDTVKENTLIAVLGKVTDSESGVKSFTLGQEALVLDSTGLFKRGKIKIAKDTLLIFTATDNSDNKTMDTIKVTVKKVVNTPPHFISKSEGLSQLIIAGETYVDTVLVDDKDSGDVVTLSVIGKTTLTNNIITWTTTTADIGKHLVKLKATDGKDTTELNFTITVVSQNVNSEGMVLVPSKGKSFLMGTNELIGQADERPAHNITFTYNFFMDTTEVTQKSYIALLGVNPSHFKGDKLPTEKATWYDAVLYMNARSKRDGKDTVYTYTSVIGVPGNGCKLVEVKIDYTKNGYRLPTEAEWQYACRAESNTRYYWGNSINNDFCWYNANSGGKTHAVGSKKPNTFGLYDMNGNVWEWCNDWYGEDYYKNSPKENPQGPLNGAHRVRLGGCFNNEPSHLRTVNRDYYDPAISFNFFGFRAVLGKINIANDSLIGHYPFDNGNAKNLTPYAPDGKTYNTQLSQNRFNKDNTALEFNNTNSYVDLQNPLDIKKEFSFSGWFYIESKPTIPWISLFMKENYSKGFGVMYHCEDNIIRVYDNQQSLGIHSIKHTLPSQKWLHFVLTYDGSKIKLYLDKKLISTFNYSSNLTDETNFYIGMSKNNTNTGVYFWSGKIDDIKVYNQPINDSMISEIFRPVWKP